ncbi:hypothetical protein BLOT_000277 [Blomia tropicalis]|nr:hypothetical protein BLOT_000277 [Blomia tropicalis]
MLIQYSVKTKIVLNCNEGNSKREQLKSIEILFEFFLLLLYCNWPFYTRFKFTLHLNLSWFLFIYFQIYIIQNCTDFPQFCTSGGIADTHSRPPCAQIWVLPQQPQTLFRCDPSSQSWLQICIVQILPCLYFVPE